MVEEQANDLCSILNETYNSNCLEKYPTIKDIFFNVRDLYEKNPEKFPNANKTFMSLVYNLKNPEEQPMVDYITGPAEISKWESEKYNKVIYVFGEDEHNNKTGCIQSKINLHRKKHMKIEKYLPDLFTHSPVFIDFYTELHIVLDNTTPNQFDIDKLFGNTLGDIKNQMSGCFGPLINRNCPYNARIHSIDVRDVLSRKHRSSPLIELFYEISVAEWKLKNEKYVNFYKLKSTYSKQINLLSSVKDVSEFREILINDIEKNEVLQKELNRSILQKQEIIDFFIPTRFNYYLLEKQVKVIREWFGSFKNSELVPDEFDDIKEIFDTINGISVDIYTVARMFKVFNVKENDHYPKEPHNIVYYAGNGHTHPVEKFLEKIGFNKTEHSKLSDSCTSMEKIKQPLFS
jgi:hypothetical protein